jgi:hypothetical protein
MKTSCGETNKGNVDCQSNNFWQIKNYPLTEITWIYLNMIYALLLAF